jgi:hypothetical protein
MVSTLSCARLVEFVAAPDEAARSDPKPRINPGSAESPTSPGQSRIVVKISRIFLAAPAPDPR